MGRSGFTDDGHASMMSWLRDSDRSSSIGTVEKFNLGYFDPDYLLEHEFEEEEDLAPVQHGQDVEELGPNAVLMKEILMLKSRVKEEEKNSKSLYDALIKHEFELAYQDQLIEEMESKIVEGKTYNEALLCQLVEEKKKIEEVKVFAVACLSVALTLGVVLYCMIEKM